MEEGGTAAFANIPHNIIPNFCGSLHFQNGFEVVDCFCWPIKCSIRFLRFNDKVIFIFIIKAPLMWSFSRWKTNIQRRPRKNAYDFKNWDKRFLVKIWIGTNKNQLRIRLFSQNTYCEINKRQSNFPLWIAAGAITH